MSFTNAGDPFIIKTESDWEYARYVIKEKRLITKREYEFEAKMSKEFDHCLASAIVASQNTSFLISADTEIISIK